MMQLYRSTAAKYHIPRNNLDNALQDLEGALAVETSKRHVAGGIYVSAPEFPIVFTTRELRDTVRKVGNIDLNSDSMKLNGYLFEINLEAEVDVGKLSPITFAIMYQEDEDIVAQTMEHQRLAADPQAFVKIFEKYDRLFNQIKGLEPYRLSIQQIASLFGAQLAR